MTTRAANTPGVGERLAALVEELGQLVAELDAERVSGGQAEALTGLFARAERLCQVGKALGARRAVDCGSWRRAGDRSPAEWLSRVSGSGTGQARATLDSVARVEAHPELSRAWRSGQLSSAQTTELAGVAAADPRAAARLAQRAGESTLRGLRDACRAVTGAARSVEEERARYAAIHRGRYLRAWRDRDGAGRLDARLTPDAYAKVVACLRPFQQGVFDDARLAGQRASHEAYAADALVAMAQAAVSRRRDGDGPAAAVTVLVDHAALLRGATEPGERCELDGIGPVPLATARAMMADAFLAAVVTDGVDVRAVAHLGRRPTARQRTALQVRDRTCVVPGCDQTERLEIDHVDGWAVTRVTTLDRLARLCRHHHHLKTYEGWTLTGTPGDWHWDPPGQPMDQELPTSSPNGRDPSRGSGAAPGPCRQPPVAVPGAQGEGRATIPPDHPPGRAARPGQREAPVPVQHRPRQDTHPPPLFEI